MKLAIGILMGLIWGALAGLLNITINKGLLKKNSTNALMAGNLARLAVDFAAMAAVYLLRDVLPFSWEGPACSLLSPLSSDVLAPRASPAGRRLEPLVAVVLLLSDLRRRQRHPYPPLQLASAADGGPELQGQRP